MNSAVIPIPDAALIDAAHHGIVTDRQRLLLSRHWARRLKLFSSKMSSSVMLGSSRSKFRGRGMEFDEVRPYQAGDDIRTIDWKVTARANGTYTKLFREERERPCHIIVDQRDSLFFGSTGLFKSVLAAELSAALGWAAFSAGDRVGAQVIGQHTEIDIRAKNSRKAVLKLVHDLHQANTDLLKSKAGGNTINSAGNQAADKTGKKLSDYIEESQRIVRPGTAVFLISDFYDIDPKAVKAISKLGRHADLTLIRISDPLEEHLPISGSLPISDGHRVAKFRLTSKAKNEYLGSVDQRISLLNQSAALSKSRLVMASTTSTARKVLTSAFQS